MKDTNKILAGAVELSPEEFEKVFGNTCTYCMGEGKVEIMGDGEGFEVDVIGYENCPQCSKVETLENLHPKHPDDK